MDLMNGGSVPEAMAESKISQNKNPTTVSTKWNAVAFNNI